MELNCFLILSSYCFDNLEGKDDSGIRHGLSVSRLPARRLGTKNDIDEQDCMRARTTVDTCQVRAGREDLMASSVLSGSSIRIEERR